MAPYGLRYAKVGVARWLSPLQTLGFSETSNVYLKREKFHSNLSENSPRFRGFVAPSFSRTLPVFHLKVAWSRAFLSDALLSTTISFA